MGLAQGTPTNKHVVMNSIILIAVYIKSVQSVLIILTHCTMISSLLLVLVLLRYTLSVAMDPVPMIMTDETNAESELTCN